MSQERYPSDRIQTLKARVASLEPVLSKKQETLQSTRSQLKLILMYTAPSPETISYLSDLKGQLRSEIGRLKKEIREAKTEIRIYEKETDPNVDDGPYVPDERL